MKALVTGQVVHQAARTGAISHSYADITRVRGSLVFEPHGSLEAVLRRIS